MSFQDFTFCGEKTSTGAAPSGTSSARDDSTNTFFDQNGFAREGLAVVYSGIDISPEPNVAPVANNKIAVVRFPIGTHFKAIVQERCLMVTPWMERFITQDDFSNLSFLSNPENTRCSCCTGTGNADIHIFQHHPVTKELLHSKTRLLSHANVNYQDCVTKYTIPATVPLHPDVIAKYSEIPVPPRKF